MNTQDILHQVRSMGCVIDPVATRQLYAGVSYSAEATGERVSDVAYGAHPRHRLDIYLPPPSAGPRPVLIFLHGGGFVRGDKSERSRVGQLFASHGFVTVLPNYRLAPECQWPAGAQDVSAVLEWAGQHVAQHGGDPAKVFVVGESAGASHAAAATLVRRFQRAQGLVHSGLTVAGVALISGVYNPRLEYLARQQFCIPTPDPRNDAYFGTATPDYAGQCIVELADAAPFPLLITYAELDPAQMQVQAGELFARLVTRLGFQPSLRVIATHNHLSQIYSLGTDDLRLSSVLLEFLNSLLPAA